MFARVTVVQGSPDHYDDAVRVINERAVPGAKQLPGLVAAYWAVDRATGKGVTFAIFDTEDSLNASEDMVRELRERSVAEVGGKIVSVETYEIVGQA
jgi:rubrerythrin